MARKADPDFEVCVYVPKVRCPHCGRDRYRSRAGDDQGDGSERRKTRCLQCGRNFSIVIEDETSESDGIQNGTR